MNPSSPPKSRLQLVREQAARGELSAEVIPRTRLVVSIDRLVEDPDNERKSHFNLEELAASVKAHGIIEPITATGLADGRYQILTGHRRYRAAKLAGLSQVEILIRQQEDSQRTRLKSLISNLQRENVPPLDLAGAQQALISETGLTQEQVAAQLGKHKAWVSGVLRILDLPEGARAKVGCTQQLLSVDALTRIARIEDPQLQSQLVDGLLSGLRQPQIRARIREARRARNSTAGATTRQEFRTSSGAVVSVRTANGSLTLQQAADALEEALHQVRDLTGK
ncbi:MAG TPA: ParB/RepB/Spo0J family partition protein [Steroidobacteraceae bacterium]|nr:ParB/RepB/Spo0J family partition protein [Steroidobacteraceae bacterium]